MTIEEQYNQLFGDMLDIKKANYCDNEYITQSQIQQHSWMIGLAEVYPNEDCVQHDPQPLLPILKKIDQQLIRIE